MPIVEIFGSGPWHYLAGSGGKILYVAMIRPDQLRRIPDGVNEEVKTFFRSEWKVINAARKCSRIGQLRKDAIVPVLDDYRLKDADSYFSSVTRCLLGRSGQERYVVLLDPDTGIAGKTASSAHVLPRHVAEVWKSMRPGDALLIYQHNALGKKREQCIQDKKTCIANAIRRPTSEVDCKPHADVCFYVVNK